MKDSNMTSIISVEDVSRDSDSVSLEICMATDKCPSNDDLRKVAKDNLEWWDGLNPSYEDVTKAEFLDRFGVEPKLGMVFLKIDGEYFDYKAPYCAMSSELFAKLSQRQRQS